MQSEVKFGRACQRSCFYGLYSDLESDAVNGDQELGEVKRVSWNGYVFNPVLPDRAGIGATW